MLEGRNEASPCPRKRELTPIEFREYWVSDFQKAATETNPEIHDRSQLNGIQAILSYPLLQPQGITLH